MDYCPDGLFQPPKFAVPDDVGRDECEKLSYGSPVDIVSHAVPWAIPSSEVGWPDALEYYCNSSQYVLVSKYL